MPYITKDNRHDLDAGLSLPLTAGELNYKITKAIDEYLQVHGLSYDSLNSAVGVLECAKLELYRRVAAPYEDKKRVAHGDVYDPSLTS